MSHNEKPNKGRVVCYVVFPWQVPEMATAEKVFATLTRLYHMGYSPIISPVYLQSTGFWTYDLQVSYSLIQKVDVLILVHEEHMTEIMLKELMKGREFNKPVVRIVSKGA